MLSLRNVLMLVVALVVASGTALYVKSWLEAERSAIAASKPQSVQVVETAAVEVLVVKSDLAAGSFITPENLEWRAWPEDGVIETHIRREPDEAADTDTLDPMQELAGAVVRQNMQAGEPVTHARVVHPGDRGFLAAVLEPGFRAVSVPVDATSGIAGFVFPGDWVDIVLTMKIRGNGEGIDQQRYIAQTVLERIRVLAIDQAVDKEEGEAAIAKTTTIEVTPKEAERIAIALEMGRLSMSLNSLSQTETDFAHQERLIGASKAIGPETVRNEARSYTLDRDVYHMLDDARLFPRKGGGPSVNVLRGSDAKVQTY